jgi:hypothetical protein
MIGTMRPPWFAFPEIPKGSIGWRMGRGEDFYNRFYRWFSGLNETEPTRFAESYPEPDEWKGFYEMIASQPWKNPEG